MRVVIAVVLAVWLALVLLLGASGAFARPLGALPLPILVGVTAPIIAFLAASGCHPPSAISSWPSTFVSPRRYRPGGSPGLGFVALYTHGVLPGFFAWPAGLGDIAIGVTAPWFVLALIHRPGFAASRLFVVWNLLGVLDLVVAVGTGALGSGLAPGIAGEVTTAAMARLPLVLVPAYLVPLFIMLHLAALLQARRVAVSGNP